jgi:hypothetical protein
VTAFTLLLMLTTALFDRAEPEHVAAATVRRNEWMSRSEAAWWLRDGRFLDVTEWAVNRYGAWPCWQIEWRRSFFTLEEQVQGTFNDLREREARQLARNWHALSKAGLIP